MVSKTRINLILSLQKKKVREDERLYVIEGDKMVKEFLAARMPVRILIAKPEFLNSLPLIHKQGVGEIVPASYDDLKKISTLKTPHNALAVIKMPDIKMDTDTPGKELTLALDCVQDPGNLGTIIRAAAWFGLRYIYCSENCVDVYNPKVIQASMGAILHVNVFYTDLRKLLESATEKKVKIYGALVDGESIYTRKLGKSGIILLGNESKGISEELIPYISDRIMIPKQIEANSGIDSLNVSMAASVILSEFTRVKGRQG
jgi:RNA methyltransferase, TrmH family